MLGHGAPEEPSTIQGQAAKAEQVPAYLKPWVARYGPHIASAQFGMVRGRRLVLSDQELAEDLATARLRALNEGGPKGAYYVELSRIDLVMGIAPEDQRPVRRGQLPVAPDSAVQPDSIPEYLKPWIEKFGPLGPQCYLLEQIQSPAHVDEVGLQVHLQQQEEREEALIQAIVDIEETAGNTPNGHSMRVFALKARLYLVTGYGPTDHAVDLTAENPGDPDEEIVRFGKRT